MNPEHVRGKMAKLNPSKATETPLESTNRDDERLLQRRTARKQWQRNAFKLHRCAQESKEIGEGADDREQEELHLKVP